MIKNNYRGIFNYRRSVEPPIYRHAHSKYQAWFLMTDILAEKTCVEPYVVRNYFPWVEGGKANNYEITVEMEMKET